MGVGVWLPDGAEGAEPPPVEQLCGFTSHERMRTGHAWWASPKGRFPSSARAEAFALYAALFIPRALEVSLDNASVVRRAQKILNGLRPP
eukprot:15082136-Alexandrium_andersonii.AAC.1